MTTVSKEHDLFPINSVHVFYDKVIVQFEDGTVVAYYKLAKDSEN